MMLAIHLFKHLNSYELLLDTLCAYSYWGEVRVVRYLTLAIAIAFRILPAEFLAKYVAKAMSIVLR